MSQPDTRRSDGEAGSMPEEQLEQTGRAELLAEENRRLRSEYTRAQQSKYRRTAYGLGVVGLLAVLGGLLFTSGREVLFVLGATGLFGAIITLYLTPGQFVTADVGERVYAAMAANETALAEDLGLSDERMYVPVDDQTVRLYIPQHAEFEIPTDPAGPLIVDDNSRGLLLEATGSALFEEFSQVLRADLATASTSLAEQLADGLVEQFELATTVDPDIDPEGGRVTFAVSDSAFGSLDRIDHPVVSFLAVGITTARAQPVTVDVARGDERADWLVTCQWTEEEAE